jgi:acyl carrier protein
VVASADASVTDGWEDDLLDRLRVKLPSYMVPVVLVRLDQMPTTVNGKLDMRALSELAIAHPEPHRSPRDTTQMRLAEIWAELLGVDVAGIGLDTDIFALGAHSMLMMLLTEAIRSAFGVELTLRTLFDSPRLEAMAVHVSNAQAVLDGESSDLEQMQW